MKNSLLLSVKAPCRPPLNFPKSARLLKRHQFQSMLRKHTRFAGQSLVFNFRNTKEPKLGITVSKKYGNAVARNRFKRLVREAFRTGKIPPVEMVVLPKKGAGPISLELVKQDFERLNREYSQSPSKAGR